MTEGQMFKPRSRFLAAALSAVLVVGMAPSFSLIAPSEAYAAGGDDFTAAQLMTQEDDMQVTSVTVLTADDDALGNYVGGVKLVIGGTRQLDMVDKGDTVTLNDTEFAYAASTSTTEAYKFRVSGSSSPYSLYLTNEAAAKLVNGTNTLTVKAKDEDCGEFTVTFNYEVQVEKKAAPVFEKVEYVSKQSEYEGAYTYIDVSVAENENHQSVIDSDWVKNVKSVTVGDKTLEKGSISSSDAVYSLNQYSFYVGIGAFSDGENILTVVADGYEDIALDIVYNEAAKTASLKEAEPVVIAQEWSVNYDKTASNNNVSLKPASGLLSEKLGDAITSLKVNGAEYTKLSVDKHGILFDSNWNIDNGTLMLSLNGFKDGSNKVAIEATGYMSAEVTIYYNAALQIASLSEIVNVADGLGNGDYALGVKAITESTYGTTDEKEFSLASQFDPNIKLTKANNGLKLTLLYSNSVDMRKIAIDGVEATKEAFGPDSFGAYTFTCAIGDLAQPHKLSFTYFTGDASMNIPNAGIVNGVATHSVYLTSYSTSKWTGFSGVVALGSAGTQLLKGSKNARSGKEAPRVYSVPVTLMHEKKDERSMAAGAFAENAQLSIASNGSPTLHVALGAVSGSFASDYKVYDELNTDGTPKDAKDAKVDKTRKDADGADVPLVIEVPVSAAAMEGDYVYLNMKVNAMGDRTVNARLKVDYKNAVGASADDATAADAVSAAIAALPMGDALTLDDEAAVMKARADYDALTAIQQGYVHVTGLTDAEAKIAELKKAAEEKAAKEAEEKKAAEEKAAKEAEEKAAAEKAAKEAEEKAAAEKAAAEEAAAKEAAEKAAKETAEKKAAEEAAAKKAAEEAAAKEAAQTIASVKLSSTSATYTGKAITPKVTVTAKNGKKVAAANYKVKYTNNVKAGKATVTVTGKGAYKGSAKATFKINQAVAKAKATTSKSLKAQNLKKKATTFTAIKLTTDGKATYKVTKKDAKKVLTFKNGKVTVKKGAKAGTYKVKVKVSAKAGKNYKALKAKTYTITVKVK